MRWRRVPPVHSPIAANALIGGVGAAFGPSRQRFDDLEEQLTRMFAAGTTLLTNSGTSALVLALEATVARGATVALPAYACIDLIAAAARAGVKVVLYDVDPETLSPDLESVRRTLADGARALVVAPLYGYPPDMRALTELARTHSVPFIEDAAQAAGGMLDSRRLGAFGDISVLSFGRGKGMTGGSGGALLVRHSQFLAWADGARARLRAGTRGSRDVVALAAQWFLARPLLYAVPSSIPALKLGEMVYHPAGEPRGLSAAAAAMLRSALRLDPPEVAARRDRAKRLLAASEGTTRLAAIRTASGAVSGYLRLAMLDTGGAAVADPHLGVVRGYPITLDQHPETQRIMPDAPRQLTGARVLRDRLFTLPTHSRVGASDLARLEEWIAAGGPARELQPETVAAV